MRTRFLSIIFTSSIYFLTSAYAEDLPEIEPTEILISGALTPFGLDRLGKPVSVLTHGQLQERAEPSIGELLAREPGISSSYFGPGASRPVIRGQSKQRVRLVENGLESGDLSSISDDHAVSVDPLSIKRVDVLRGPSSLLYGSSSIGGIVNMVDEAINEEPIGKTVTGEIDFRKGDEADEEGSGALSLNGQAGSFNWHFSSFYRETDDIEIPGFSDSSLIRDDEEEGSKGKLENSQTLSRGFKAGTTYILDNGWIGVALRHNSSRYGVPGAHAHSHEDAEDTGISSVEDGAAIELDQFRFESRGEVLLEESFFQALRFGSSYSDYDHQEYEGRNKGTSFDSRSFEGRLELTHRHPDEFEGGLGLQLKYQDFNARGEEAFVPKNESFNPALFLVEDYKLSERLIWQLGSRYEYARISPENFSAESFHLLNVSSGIVRQLDSEKDLSVAFNLAYSERAPTAAELFSNGRHTATQTFETGDRDLQAERSTGAEISFTKSRGRLTGSSSFFWQHYFDYINLSPTGESKDDLPVFSYSMERARFWGFEQDLDLKLLAGPSYTVSFYGQIDYVRGENLSQNDDLPRITPLRGVSGLKYEDETFSAYVEGVFAGDQNKTAQFELPTDNYSMLNLGAAYKIPAGKTENIELYLRGTNLTNEEARVHTSFLKDLAPLRGRALMAGLRINF